MTNANVAPNLRDRNSKLRHRNAASADNRGRYLTSCKIDFSAVESIALYDRV